MRAAGPSHRSRLPPLRSRAALALATVTVAALAALPATAQDPDGEPGCVEANPCDLILAVDADGFADVSETEFTHMDWLVATIVNHDDVEHTVSLSGHDLQFTVGAGDLGDADPFRINAPGAYTLSDQPSGDTVTITSIAEEEFEEDGEGRGSPGLAPLLALGAFAAVAAFLRRRE